MPKKTVLVAVKPEFEIPYTIMLQGNTYSLDPQCEIPEDLATMIVTNSPDKFFLVGDKVIDTTEYRVRDIFQGKTLEEIFRTLPEKDRVEIYTFVKKKAADARKREQKEAERKRAAEAEANRAAAGPDALMVQLNIADVPADTIAEVAEEVTGEKSGKPAIKKVR